MRWWGGVNDNADAISKLQESPIITPIYIEERITSSSTFSYTGVSFTIPAYSVFVASACAFYNYTTARSVGICRSSESWTASYALAYGELQNVSSGHARTILCYRTTSRSQTFYVWGAWDNNTSENTVYVYGFYFNY